MQAEDIIYDAGILRIAACLEGWLRNELRDEQKRERLKTPGYTFTFEKLVERYMVLKGVEYNSKTIEKLERRMEDIRKARNAVVHRQSEDYASPRCDFSHFKQVREWAVAIENTLDRKTGMTDVMISSTLPYYMGNAGDFIKHGALAIYVDWWAKEMRHQGPKQPLRYADPFGGRPWGWVTDKEIKARLLKIKPNSPLIHAWDGEKYYGSGHVVRRAAKHANILKSKIFVSDADKLALEDLRATGLQIIGEGGNCEGYHPSDGYGILNFTHKFDLILLDPFADFLPQAVGGPKLLETIVEKCEGNKNLCVAVFVLDRCSTKSNKKFTSGVQETHDKYENWKKENEENLVFLRCPRLKPTDKYDMEFLLVSKQFSEPSDKVANLRKALADFSGELTEILGVEVEAG